MGAKLSTQNRRRVASRLHASKNIGNKNQEGIETKNKNPSYTSLSCAALPVFTTSQSSDGIVRNGRTFHNEQTSTYWFPNDDEEIDRLVGQHFALKTLFNGNIPEEALVDNALPFEDGAKILDLGCGPGTWIMDVATEYPNSEFIGVDMCDIFPNNIRPANVTFQVGNVLEGLAFEDNSFDMVSLRFFILAFRTEEWAGVLKEIRRVLKPGGFMLSIEPGMLEIGSDFVCWAGKIFKDKMLERGQEPYISDEMKKTMELAEFEVVHCVKKHTYLGRPDHLNREFLWDIRSIFKSGQAFLAESFDISNEKYPAFLDQLTAECQKLPETRWSMVSTMGRKPF
ncbi:S-adenosyl-L-methionine-dependent methyltransferase [Mucor mucedo]|uniref:S-adenosyl-L-methionine-dependent methyltransferase n=1 Tax=Mucor mucedo TaxID=29922 RepID=UPI00221E3C3A|nr:S-adenosyl-L-methionine-dependent methyltransferase [Mucor mucedo]KAI7865985.1 S-adenosyl-L-methionine-dependent methyltransferase [Mucor mucedo]